MRLECSSSDWYLWLQQGHKRDITGRCWVVEAALPSAQRLRKSSVWEDVRFCMFCSQLYFACHHPKRGSVTAASRNGSEQESRSPSLNHSRSSPQMVLLGETLTPQFSLHLHWPLNQPRCCCVKDFI